MKRLDEQVALVTGASRGIGRAVAKELADYGAAVVVNYNQSPDAAASLVKEIIDGGSKAISVQASVDNAEQCQALVQKTIDEFGKIDILVNNAGVNRDKTLRRMAPDEWDEVISTDLNSAFYCSSAAIPPIWCWPSATM